MRQSNIRYCAHICFILPMLYINQTSDKFMQVRSTDNLTSDTYMQVRSLASSDPDRPQISVEITFEIKFIKSTMFKYMIESNTKAEMTKWLTDYFAYLKQVRMCVGWCTHAYFYECVYFSLLYDFTQDVVRSICIRLTRLFLVMSEIQLATE